MRLRAAHSQGAFARVGFLCAPLILGALSMSAGKVSAQPVQEGGFVNPTYNMQLFRPAIDTKGYVTLNASQVLGHKEFSLGLVGTWAGKPLALEILGGSTQPLSGMVVTNGRKFTVSHLITAQLQFAIGLFKHAELGLTVPLSIMQGNREVCEPNKDCGGFLGSTDSRDDLSFSKVGFADPGIHVKGRFLNTSKYPVGLGGMLSVYLPLDKWAGGDGHKHFLSESNLTLHPQIMVDKEWGREKRFRTAINVGALVRFGGTTFTDFGKPRVVDNVMGMARTFCYPADNTSGEFSSMSPFSDCGSGLSRSVGTQLTYGIGASWNVINKYVDLLGEFYGYADVTGNAKAFPLEGLGAVKLYLAKKSFLLLGAGGGIAGLSDSGRQTGGPLWRAFIGFVFEPLVGDRDGDGLKDDIDKCPDDPEDFDDFEDEDGCPEPDNDRDGILDVDDKCPNEPETKNGYQDEDGCPDSVELDRDGDGIPDNVDKCPDDPEDKDGFEDEDGCPDPDNDRDGILDKDDKCPNDPEVYNGFEDEDGCPDKGRVILRRGKLEILDKIYFETDKAIIKPISYPILDAVAATLKGNPEISGVEIQGHADERGDDAHNMQLTEARSQAVRSYLIEKGVDAGRLQAHGYGETKPVCEQHNEDCWSQNRRVEFVILKRSDEGGKE